MRGRPGVCHDLGTGLGPVDNSRSLEPPPTLANTMQVRELVEAAPPVMWNEPGDPLRVIGGPHVGAQAVPARPCRPLSPDGVPKVLGVSGEERIPRDLPAINLRLFATRVLDRRFCPAGLPHGSGIPIGRSAAGHGAPGVIRHTRLLGWAIQKPSTR